MAPEYTAYQISAHSHVPCVECHIGTGAQAYFNAKINGTKQLLEVSLHPLAPLAPKIIPNYPTPIPSPVTSLRPARYTCEACHTPTRFDGDKLLVKSSFADDEQNTESQTVLILHLGGVDSFSQRTGIHGVHLGHIEYITTDPTRTTIPWVQRTNPDGTLTTYAASALNGAQPQGERRVMDCIDCHNRAAHTFVTAEEAINSAMADGVISPSLPFIHKEGLELLKSPYTSQEEARVQIPQQLEAFYRSQHPEVLAAKSRAGEGRRTGTLPALQPECVSVHEGHLGNASQPHRAPGISRLLPLPRRRPRGQGRHQHHAGLLRLPQPAGRGRSQAQGAFRPRHPVTAPRSCGDHGPRTCVLGETANLNKSKAFLDPSSRNSLRISSAPHRKNLFSVRLISLYNQGEAPSYARTAPKKWSGAKAFPAG